MTAVRQPGDSQERVRAFLALLAPTALVDAATAVQEELRGTWPSGRIRWVEPRNFHVTVRFFGELEPARLASVSELVRRTEIERNEVRLGKCSAFPTESRPSVLWVSLEDPSGRLDGQVRELEARLESAGFGPPDKPWKSHLTLGRVPREGRLRAREEEFRAVRLPGERFFLDELALMRSDLRPQGPVYSPIETVRAKV